MQSKESQKLRECPFCGGIPKFEVKKGIRTTLRCPDARCYLFYSAPTSFNNGDTDEHAKLRLTTWWNRRASDVADK